MNKLLPVLLLTVLAAAPAAARGPEAPPIFAKLKPKVGSWGEYSFEIRKGDKLKSKGVLRMSVVGKEGDALWVEQKFTVELPKPKKDEMGGTMKMLIGKEGAEKFFMKTEQGVMDMSGMMKMGARKKQEVIDKTKLVEAGVETIEVPAGKYKATHYTFGADKETGDSWFKPGVGPYGLIKQAHNRGKEVSTLELLSSGDGAKSEVDEKSAQSPMGAMMGRGRRPEAGEEQGEAAKRSDEDAPKRPKGSGFGGLFKKAIKQQAGIGE